MSLVLKYGTIKAKVKQFVDLLEAVHPQDTKHPYFITAQSWAGRNVVAQHRIIYFVEATLLEKWKPLGTWQGSHFTHQDIADLEYMLPSTMITVIHDHLEWVSPAATPSPPSSPSTDSDRQASLQQRRDSPIYEEPVIMLGDMDMGNSSGSENGGHGSYRSSQR